ncbi:MAG: M3 family metallopeptidase [Hyphomicrobiaceae bacterium]|nr:M3 family metallopeptidase [Hyphomicrobiaceae bacterium]
MAKPVSAKTRVSKTKAKPGNPLLATWRTPFKMPPFADIGPAHYLPAFKAAFAEHRDEIKAIATATSKPTFNNTIVALEKAGESLSRVAEVFYNLSSADTNEQLQAIERELAPQFAAHYSGIYLNAKLFARIADLHERRERLDLDDEQARVLDRTNLSFVRAGAKLSAKNKKRVAEINGSLAELKTQFSQNVLADEQDWRLILNGEADLAGLPEGVREAAARTAADLGLEGHAITLARSSVESFLQFSSRRDLREEAFNAWTRRGENGGKTDNREIVAKIVGLRSELAKLLGYATYADFALDDTMAKTPAAVRDLLGQVWSPAVKRAAEERDALQKLAQSEGGNFPIAAWDWRYYAEKERKARFDLDDGEVRPYLQLDNMIAAAFDTASKLFGLKFKELPDAPRYHPDVRVWEVLTRGGEHVGVFLGDYFARPSKQSGAWMSAFRSQMKLGGEQRPIIVNVMNFARGAEGESTLLSFDDARTLFHEFGHGLHGLLSDVTYPSLAGTAVSRDFVELPSQLYEHWLSRPEVLEKFALHEKTGKPMPKKLLERLKAARNFNQGFATVEFTSSALVDMDLHSADPDGLDVTAFERETLARISMPQAMVMRHRIPHFLHIMGGYAAGYYSYLWSEVMDADAFAAFVEAGDVFDKKTAGRLKKHIYSAGNRRDPAEAYVAFRGRPPEIRGLLKQRGFAA